MVFVYFAFWGLQEEFSTLPCSPALSAPDAAMILGLFSQKNLKINIDRKLY
jgi:hypothetical protein